MKYDYFEVVNRGNSIPLRVTNASQMDRYVLRNIDGLGPTDRSVSIMDGHYQGTDHRNLVMTVTVDLNPNYATGETVADIRERLYKILLGSADTTIHMRRDGVTTPLASVSGRVSDFDPSIFSKTSMVQFTIECYTPMWEAPTAVTWTPPAPTSSTVSNIAVGGSAPTGFKFEITFSADVLQWSLEHSAVDRFMITGIQAGDKYVVDTREGSRGITLTRAGVTKNAIFSLADNSKWVQLEPNIDGKDALIFSSSNFTWGPWTWKPKIWGA